MPKICESCKHYVKFGDNLVEFCENPKVVPADHPYAKQGLWILEADEELNVMGAREICDREGDGRFVHYEPATPSAGAAAAGTAGSQPATAATPQSMTAGGTN